MQREMNVYFIRNALILLMFLGGSPNIIAQPIIDTMVNSIKKKPTMVFGKIGTRNSFIDNYRARILGVLVGLNYSNHVRFGVGYHQLYKSASMFDKPVYFNNLTNGVDTLNAELKIWYCSVMGEFIYFNSPKWKFSIPLQFGLGQGYYKCLYKSETFKINKSLLFVYEPAVSVEYKIMDWIGAGANIGFRFFITDYKKFDEKLNSPTYSIYAVIHYSEIYKYVLKKSKGVFN